MDQSGHQELTDIAVAATEDLAPLVAGRTALHAHGLRPAAFDDLDLLYATKARYYAAARAVTEALVAAGYSVEPQPSGTGALLTVLQVTHPEHGQATVRIGAAGVAIDPEEPAKAAVASLPTCFAHALATARFNGENAPYSLDDVFALQAQLGRAKAARIWAIQNQLDQESVAADVDDISPSAGQPGSQEPTASELPPEQEHMAQEGLAPAQIDGEAVADGEAELGEDPQLALSRRRARLVEELARLQLALSLLDATGLVVFEPTHARAEGLQNYGSLTRDLAAVATAQLAMGGGEPAPPSVRPPLAELQQVQQWRHRTIDPAREGVERR